MSPILGIFASQGRVGSTAYESIQTVTVGAGGASSISFTSIPSTFKHLQIRGITRASSGNAYTKLRFNNDSSNVYTYHSLFGSGTSALTDVALSQNGASAVTVAAGSLASNIFSGAIIDILDYTNTNKNTTIRDLSGFDSNGGGQVVFGSGLWINTSAITQIDLLISASTYAQYSSFALYGIKG